MNPLRPPWSEAPREVEVYNPPVRREEIIDKISAQSRSERGVAASTLIDPQVVAAAPVQQYYRQPQDLTAPLLVLATIGFVVAGHNQFEQLSIRMIGIAVPFERFDGWLWAIWGGFEVAALMAAAGVILIVRSYKDEYSGTDYIELSEIEFGALKLWFWIMLVLWAPFLCGAMLWAPAEWPLLTLALIVVGLLTVPTLALPLALILLQNIWAKK